MSKNKQVTIEISPGVEKRALEDAEVAEGVAKMAGDAVIRTMKEDAGLIPKVEI